MVVSSVEQREIISCISESFMEAASQQVELKYNVTKCIINLM